MSICKKAIVGNGCLIWWVAALPTAVGWKGDLLRYLSTQAILYFYISMKYHVLFAIEEVLKMKLILRNVKIPYTIKTNFTFLGEACLMCCLLCFRPSKCCFM